MVDAVVSIFLEKLITAVADQSRVVLEFDDQFDRLKRQLQLMQSFLKDADRQKRRKGNETLRSLLDDLRGLIYDSEDLLADCLVQSAKHPDSAGRLVSCFSPSLLSFRARAWKRLQEINQRIGEIKENIRSYLVPPLMMGQANGGFDDHQYEARRWSSPVYDQSQIVGLEEDAKKIKDWISMAGEGLTCIGIVGMGGLGKTTVAQKVFSGKEVEDRFEKRMWVSVSQSFKEEEIMRSMLKNLGDMSSGDAPGELLRKIHQCLVGKRYLIVMDDVWSVRNGWWRRLCDGLVKGNGSCIIITTRIEEVARMMDVAENRIHRPKVLSANEAWTLFCKIAFAGNGGVCSKPELEQVGHEIVGRCNGLPLAIKAVGGIILCKSPSFAEWRRIADNFREELANNDDSVMASLQLSYDELPSYLKPCFLCFAVFPEDCVIPNEQIIYWWIGEGFIPTRNGFLQIESAEDCLVGLMNRCLVEAIDKRYNKRFSMCKIHDMVRELVRKIAEEEGFYKLSSADSRRFELTSTTNGNRLAANAKLRALISTTKSGEVNKVSSMIAKKVCKFKYLRVLDLSKSIHETYLKDQLKDIGSLKLLRYVSLRNTHPMTELPNSMEKLDNLLVLDLSYCHTLKYLPPFITNFTKLTVLDVSYCGSLRCMPKELEQLSNLQVLLGFKPSSSEGCRIAELKGLRQLKILELQITQGDDIECDEVGISQLLQLKSLTINCFGSHDDLIGKLDKLQPPPQLHEISLKFFPGKETPIWLNPISLPRLEYLSIFSGNLAHMGTGFWGWGSNLWKLDGLTLESLADLEEEWSSIIAAMPSLRVIKVSWCPKLISFPIEDHGFRGGEWRRQ